MSYNLEENQVCRLLSWGPGLSRKRWLGWSALTSHWPASRMEKWDQDDIWISGTHFSRWSAGWIERTQFSRLIQGLHRGDMQNKKHILATVESDVACYQVDGTAVSRLKTLFSQSRDRWCYLGLLDIHSDLIVCIVLQLRLCVLIMAGNSLGVACMLCSKGGNMCSLFVFSNRDRMTEDDERRRRIAQADSEVCMHNWTALFWCNRPWDLCSALLYIFVQVYLYLFDL